MSLSRRHFLGSAASGLALAYAGCAGVPKPGVGKPAHSEPDLLSMNIGQAVLELESQWVGLDSSCYSKLHDIISRGRCVVDRSQQPVKILSSLDRMLRSEFGFSVSKEADVGLLSEALLGRKVRRMDCDTAAILYLAVAEMTGLPLQGVLAPRHMFVRWNRNDGHLNWETTMGGPISDKEYMKRYEISRQAISAGAYLTGLGKKELLAVCLVPIGNKLARMGAVSKAQSAYKAAIQQFPQFAMAYYCVGQHHFQKEQYSETIRHMDVAIRLEPNYAGAHFFKGRALAELGDLEGAVQHFELATKYDVSNVQAMMHKWLSLKRLGRTEGASKAYDEATVYYMVNMGEKGSK
ncbi:tetratricopeptide repeat protein [Nanoarchaeota archaeon]